MKTYEDRAAGIRDRAGTLLRQRRARRRRLYAVTVPLVACVVVCLALIVPGGGVWRPPDPAGEAVPSVTRPDETVRPGDVSDETAGPGDNGLPTAGPESESPLTPEGTAPGVLVARGESGSGYGLSLPAEGLRHIQVSVDGDAGRRYTDPAVTERVRASFSQLVLTEGLAIPESGASRTVTFAYTGRTIVCELRGERGLRLAGGDWMTMDTAGSDALRTLLDQLERSGET